MNIENVVSVVLKDNHNLMNLYQILSPTHPARPEIKRCLFLVCLCHIASTDFDVHLKLEKELEFQLNHHNKDIL